VTQYQEAAFTVRLDGNDIKTLTITDINKLNDELASKGLKKLSKIRRSNGDTEYVSQGALKQLEEEKRRRRQQRQLQELREGTIEKPKAPNRFVRAIRELLK